MKWVTTSWTHSIYITDYKCFPAITKAVQEKKEKKGSKKKANAEKFFKVKI